MKPSAFLVLVLVPTFSTGSSAPLGLQKYYDPICQENPAVVDQMDYNDYQIKISSAGDQSCESFDIVKNGELLYHDEEIGGHFYLGSDMEKGSGRFLGLPGTDGANFIVSKWTGGAHCCFSLHIFELGRKFRPISHIEGGNFHPYFEDLDKDGIPEIRVTDDFLAEIFSSFASSATADVVLRYSEGTYKVATDLMKQPAPHPSSLDRKIRSWQEDFQETNVGDYPPPALVQTVTNLFYTGHKELAMDVIHRSWPSDVPGKADFMREYEMALKESLYYGEFERQL